MKTERTASPRKVSRVLLALLALATAGSVLLAAASPNARATSHENAVLDWNAHALAALANATSAPTPGAGQAPTVTVIHMAMVQGAVFDAVGSIGGTSDAASTARAAATARAAHDVLVSILNQQPLSSSYTSIVRAAIITRLDAALAAAPSSALGSATGQAAALAMLAERTNDGRFPASPFTFTPGTEPGQWRPTGSGNDPNAWVAKVKPFVVESNTQFLSKGPHDMKSGIYAKEYNEVKALGEKDESTRTAEQTALANFYTQNPVEMFNRSFRTYAVGEGLGMEDQAEFFALLNTAGADSHITCWEDKATWSFWRPQTAIQNGDMDGNPKTEKDADWEPLVPNPPYPDHSSGYNCVTGAFMEIAENYFGHGRTEFTVVRSPTTTTAITYEHFRDVCKDTIDARIYLGIHFRAPDVQAVEIGRDVARWVWKHGLDS